MSNAEDKAELRIFRETQVWLSERSGYSLPERFAGPSWFEEGLAEVGSVYHYEVPRPATHHRHEAPQLDWMFFLEQFHGEVTRDLERLWRHRRHRKHFVVHPEVCLDIQGPVVILKATTARNPYDEDVVLIEAYTFLFAYEPVIPDGTGGYVPWAAPYHWAAYPALGADPPKGKKPHQAQEWFIYLIGRVLDNRWEHRETGEVVNVCGCETMGRGIGVRFVPDGKRKEAGTEILPLGEFLTRFGSKYPYPH